jgi:hypothetical protein
MKVHNVDALPLYLLNKIEMCKPGPLWTHEIRRKYTTSQGIIVGYLTSTEIMLIRGLLVSMQVRTQGVVGVEYTVSDIDVSAACSLTLDCVLANECA